LGEFHVDDNIQRYNYRFILRLYVLYIYFKFISSSFFRKLRRSIFEAHFKLRNYNVNNFVNVINFIHDTLVKGYFTCSHRIFTRRQLTMVRSTTIPSSLFTHHLFRIPLGLPLYSWYPVRNVSTYRRKETRKTYKTTSWKYSRETVIRFYETYIKITRFLLCECNTSYSIDIYEVCN